MRFFSHQTEVYHPLAGDGTLDIFFFHTLAMKIQMLKMKRGSCNILNYAFLSGSPRLHMHVKQHHRPCSFKVQRRIFQVSQVAGPTWL